MTPGDVLVTSPCLPAGSAVCGGLAAGSNVATGGVANFILCVLITVAILFGILFYVIYVPCCKRQRQHSELVADPSDHENSNSEEHALSKGDGAAPTSSLSVQMNPSKDAPRPRLYFLDNIKSLLTIIVVSHHISGSFGGAGWIYNIGGYYNPFLIFSSSVMGLNQSYFMCLFFFISGI